jgi:hypothetical protein
LGGGDVSVFNSCFLYLCRGDYYYFRSGFVLFFGPFGVAVLSDIGGKIDEYGSVDGIGIFAGLS